MKPKVPQKRKYNAAFRLRQKIGEAALPKRSKIIYPAAEPAEVAKHPEAKILISEYGFIIKPELF